ncbi:methyltransferase domain-containing protein [Baekduia sp. Peel2402]|uniref:methyltransferase domain-containing protein n=1 Tax=Baekduia sp. Peel2402 TaxID=3458296 RepID=UPI00403E411E
MPSPADDASAHAEALELAAAGQDDAARALLADAVRRQLDPEAINDLAVLAHRCGDATEAVALLEALTHLAPDHTAARENLESLREIPAPWPPRLDRIAADGAVAALIEDHAELDPLRPGWMQRLEFERQLSVVHRDDEQWLVPGYCATCSTHQLFRCDWVSTWGGTPNFRERLHCPRCHLNSRQRLVTQLVKAMGQPPYYVYELVTTFYQWAATTLPQVTGSEYLGHDVPGGSVINGLRHEDALELSFADDSFGTIVSCDVFEHVADIDRALQECARVLRPGGTLILSVPFDPDSQTVQRVELRDGEPVHLLEPVYHGNPLDQEKGSLTFYDHGWDLVDRMRSAGFSRAGVVAAWSQYHGYLGRGMQFVLVAQR